EHDRRQQNQRPDTTQNLHRFFLDGIWTDLATVKLVRTAGAVKSRPGNRSHRVPKIFRDPLERKVRLS
ncbi:MAG: hypothetical protein E6699_35190, partial [Bradyrhizobium sp.]|uniref:hypothetical protein n=1 Tax=Bradyrhizobium sp. TaxID=376 RepID=UPI0029028CAA